MTPINNSDTAWLIVTDYNQDNGKFYEELREDIYCPSINDWSHEFKDRFDVNGTGKMSVGGNEFVSPVGTIHLDVDSVGFGGSIGFQQARFVGDNDPN